MFLAFMTYYALLLVHLSAAQVGLAKLLGF